MLQFNSPDITNSSQTRIQARLKIGQSGDKYEQEADAAADKVMRMSKSETLQMQPMEEEEELLQPKLRMQPMEVEEEMLQPQIQMQEEEEEAIQMKCNGCERDEMLQTKSNSDSTFASNAFTQKLHTTKGNGKSLSPKMNQSMSNSFGSDFSSVKIHEDNHSVQMNEQLQARAFTHGSDIYFNSGQYNPDSSQGKRLLSHELTHVVQQDSAPLMIQSDLAIEPTTPNARERTLTAAQIQTAIAFNQSRHTDAAEISLMRDILGIAQLPADIDENFVTALASYQSQYGLTQDGKLGHDTADRLAKEIIAEGAFLGPGNLGSLAPEFQIKTNISTLVSADNRTYADYKNIVQAGTMVQRHVALNDQQLLTDLKAKLSWNNWARCIELLGRLAPSGNEMRINSTVRAAMRVAWTDSNPAITRWPTPDPANALAPQCDPIVGSPPTNAHEEGGFIYLNLINGNMTTRRVAAGGQAALPLNNPPNVANSIVVGGFHTHPNVGNCWGAPFFSGADVTWSSTNGVPLLMIGAFPGVADNSFHATGTKRLHLAGNRGVPGAAGGLAPQATRDGRHDDL